MPRFPRWRLYTVIILSAAAVVMIFIRIVQIQILRHEEYERMARGQQQVRQSWPARRGSIYDRNGLPLAVTRRTCTIGMTPRDLPRDAEAVELLVGACGRSRGHIDRLRSSEASYIPLSRKVSLTYEEEMKLSSIPGVRIDPDPERIHPFECLAPTLLGTVTDDGRGSGGIELAFDDRLRGRDGWVLVNRDAHDREYRRLNAPGKKPENGFDLLLTIDSRIQAIVDFELEQAVSRYGAISGAAVVIDPRTGDVYALAEKAGDGSGSSAGGLFSTSCQFEPGSTFKLITCAYLLEKAAADPYDVFFGEYGEAEFDFGTFRDDHPVGWQTLKQTFKHSSNICTIKAVMDSDPDDFYEFLLRFGMGGRTGVELPAESPGTLREPGDWSGRSLPSIAIGQEIGVTLMQMAMAYCAVANGGHLMVPRVALEVRDGDGNRIEEFRSVEVRRVISPFTARTLKEFCREVVVDGTGGNAAVDGLAVAGKTGTAQKADAHGYIDGRWVASFAGFVPADDPALVCMVVLDEPDYSYHYGGSSSAIVFREIIEGINLSTDILSPGADRTIAIGVPGDDMVEVPNFYRLRCAEAVRLAYEQGINVSFSSDDGEVYSQIPGPGTLMEKGGDVYLSFSSREAGKVIVPEVRGLSIRHARRMLIECGLSSRISGTGTVSRQDPPPGRSVDRGSVVSMECVAEARKTRRSGYAMSRGSG